MDTSTTGFSGVGLTVRPERYREVVRMVGGVPGASVHGGDPATGRIVVVQEHAGVAGHEDGLRRLQALPGVLAAGLVCHYQLDATTEVRSSSQRRVTDEL